MVKFLKEMNVFVRPLLFGMGNGANKQIVRRVKYGMGQAAPVSQVTTGMEVCVCCVSTDSNGILSRIDVFALNHMFGMEIFARKFTLVLETVFSMRLFSNVFVDKISSGMDFHAWFSHSVVVGKSST